jgi:uncharacterized protein YbcI
MFGVPSPCIDDTHVSPRGGELNAALTRALVRRNAEFTGRGPSKARAFYSANVLVVILENAMTSAEHRLAAHGKGDLVLQLRREFQLTMRAELVELVEELSGCRVVAFLSDNSIDPDLACEVFVLDRPIPG